MVFLILVAFQSYLLINAVNYMPVCLTTRVICSVLYRTLIIWSQRRIAQVFIIIIIIIIFFIEN